MAVYYKFKSAKDYDTIPIEGQFISVGNLKERIFESKRLGGGTDFDLVVSNPQTDEEYLDEAALVPKNTSVLIRRVPGRPRKTIVSETIESNALENREEGLQQISSMFPANSTTTGHPEEIEWDEFGTDLYAIPEVTPALPSNPVVSLPPASRIDEDNKLKALVETPAFDFSRQTHDAYGFGRGFGRGNGGRMIGGRGFGRGGFERKTPPAGYICHRCKIPGHLIQHCPTNGDPTYDIRRVKPPTGIPKSMLMATPDGSYALPSGAAAVLKPNEAAFEKEIDGLPSTRSVSDIPPELRCPLCKEVMKDAVLTSKCCFRSFCDKCIRDYTLTKSICVCGATNVLADDLLPNRTLRETISHILEATTSSTENAGSWAQIPDMESARNIQPKVLSPTMSAASKNETKLPPPKEYPLDAKDVKESVLASEGKGANVAAHFLDKKSAKAVVPFEATSEPISGKEPISSESGLVREDAQEKLLTGEQGKKKKKKKARLPGSAADLQWRAYQDSGAENFSGMLLGSSGFNPYWGGGMPLGMDGYLAPFTGAMPYMSYPPGTFDVPFAGFLPQDPFAAQGYMMPGVPQRDLSELGMGMGMHQRPPIMSREEFEARKADLRRKRDLERMNGRENSKDHYGDRERSKDHYSDRDLSKNHHDRGASSNMDVPPVKARPRLMSQAVPLDRSDRSDRLEVVERAEKGVHRSDRADRSEVVEKADKEWRHHRPSPPRSGRRRSLDRGEAASIAAAAGVEGVKADKKQKGSVFSRISFPGSGEDGGSKKRKPESSNGQKEHDKSQEEEERKMSTGGRRGAAGSYDQRESSGEEHHFKRRPSSSRREAEGGREEDGGGRGSRRSSRPGIGITVAMRGLLVSADRLWLAACLPFSHDYTACDAV